MPIPAEPPHPVDIGGGFTVSPEKSTEMVEDVIKKQYKYSQSGLFCGLLCIFGGIVLFILGVTGSVEWLFNLFGLESKVINAAPGIILFIIGLFVIWITRFSVRIR